MNLIQGSRLLVNEDGGEVWKPYIYTQYELFIPSPLLLLSFHCQTDGCFRRLMIFFLAVFGNVKKLAPPALQTECTHTVCSLELALIVLSLPPPCEYALVFFYAVIFKVVISPLPSLLLWRCKSFHIGFYPQGQLYLRTYRPSVFLFCH